jgi:hypothetical protein
MRKELMHPLSLLLTLGMSATVFGQLPAGWTGKDLGGPAAAGSVQYDKATSTWTIKGDGTGIRGKSDQFYFVYKTLSGNGELSARVASLDPALSDWSMAGVMLRVFPTADSPYLFMGVSANIDTHDHGITFWGRMGMGEAADNASAGATGAPCWVKVKRSGDTFSGYASPDGKNWTEVYSASAPGMPSSILIGYAVTSEAGGKLVTAVFDNGPTKASAPNPPDGAKDVVEPVLAWTAGAVAVKHEVYVGTTADLGAADYRTVLTGSAPKYVLPDNLLPGTTYYWRIDEVSLDGTRFPGDTWSFTTAVQTAYGPQPWNGIYDVALEADLTWTPGADAVSHDVYFGPDKAAVAAGDTSVFKGKQEDWTCDPGTLTARTTYYWRIDEQDSQDVVHPGPVWSFTTVGPETGVKAQYFNGMELAGSPVLTRVEPSIEHNWGGGEVAAGLSNNVSARWTADLLAVSTETCQLITTTDDGVRLWLDGRRVINNWTDHGSTDDAVSVSLDAGHVYLLEMEWYDNTSTATAVLSWQSPSIPKQIVPSGVLLLPRRAVSPYPAHKAQDVPGTLLMHWTAGETATGHDVYFGDSADAVANANPVAADIYCGRQAAKETTFDPGPLEPNKTYYWRVDEVNAADPANSWTGAVWSFTTAGFLVVDDFESYTDYQGNRIYQTWIDGLINQNGSQVGYNDAPFAEQTVVHAGYQSMPLDYNNTKSPWYSQAERTWTAPQDWTAMGGDTLVLSVRGLAANTPESLYVAFEDKAGHTVTIPYSDPALVTAVLWTEWKIPLTSLGTVNAATIQKMYLGVGNRDHPTPGGAGRIYVDDLRVIKL